MCVCVCVCVCVCILSIFARQRPGKHVSATTNIHAIEEVLDASSSTRSVSYQSKLGDYLFPKTSYNIIVQTSGSQLVVRVPLGVSGGPVWGMRK
jgi:hypothetical protein